jgi:hypothetical protein
MLGVLRRLVAMDSRRWLPGACAVLCLALALAGCARLRGRPDTGDAEIFERVLARSRDARGLEGEGTVVIEYGDEAHEVPFTVSMDRASFIDVEANIDDLPIPFAGKVRLVADDSGAELYTPIGIFDPFMGEVPYSTVYGLLVSAFGGGDWLAAWLEDTGCRVASNTTCGDLEIELHLQRSPATISRWRITDAADKGSFEASVSEYQPGAVVLPRSIEGTLYPQRIGIVVEYSRIAVR